MFGLLGQVEVVALQDQVTGEVGLELLGQECGHFGRRQHGVFDHLVGPVGSFWATAANVSAQEGLDAALTQGQEVMGIGATAQDGAQELAFQGLGADQG